LASLGERLPYGKDSWLADYVEFNKDQEGSLDYILWTGLTCISAAVGRGIFIRRGMEQIRANLYTLLLGPTGNRKSDTGNVGQKLVAEAKVITVGATQTTPQKLMLKLERCRKPVGFSKKVGGDEDELDTQMEYHSPLFHFASELSLLLGRAKMDPTILQFLTHIYDTPDEHIYDRIGDDQKGDKGKVTIHAPYLVILGASNPAYLADALPTSAQGGGLMARCICIHAEDVRKRIAWPTPDFSLKPKLISGLQAMAQMKGEMYLTQEVKEAYERWYMSYGATQKDTRDMAQEGFFERKPTHLMKIMMILAACDKQRKRIGVADMIGALDLLDGVEKMLPKVMKDLGTHQVSSDIQYTYDMITKYKNIGRSDLLKRVYRRGIKKDDLTEICGTLQAMGVIESVPGGLGGQGGGTHYLITGELYDTLTSQDGVRQSNESSEGGKESQSDGRGTLDRLFKNINLEG
jgi:hypothetical protein